jgi:hypothetical protein
VRASIAFASGVVGAVATILGHLVAGTIGQLPPAPATLASAYQRLVWGGLFGLLLLVPLLPRRPLARGVVASLVPATARLTLFAPPGGIHDARALVGVFVLNALWGITAAHWYEHVQRR